MSIKEIFDKIVGERIRDFSGVVASVNSVDMGARTCEVTTIDDAVIPDVRLVAANTTGLVLKPTVGSFVIIQMISDNGWFVTMFSQVDEIDMLDASNGGLIRVADMITKMNNLENKLNDVITAYNSHAHTGVTTGPGTSGPTPTTITGSLTPTVRGDIENVKVKHGI
jgi:hypothetical protein